ncbi:glycosyltransferase [Methylophilaceae bacterium]|nr:glycosyltransferase [Methylophilaceae bacterium]
MIRNKIIVLLAAYKGENFIMQQIETILNQSIKPSKIFVNIDFSDDETLNISKYYSKKFPQIKILNTNKRFGSAAANFIDLLSNIDLKETDFIAFSDQDDVWKTDKLKRAIQKLGQGYDGYSSNVEAFWEDGRKKVLIKNQPQQCYDHLFESAGPGCTFVISKKLAFSLQQFLKKGQFNHINNYHDWLIYAFARCNAFKWFIDSYSGVNYRQHASNVFGANVGLVPFLSRINRVLTGEGFDFAFHLINKLKVKDEFIQSLFPIGRINLLRLAFHANHCRRRFRDKVYFFFACLLLAIIFPKKLYIS